MPPLDGQHQFPPLCLIPPFLAASDPTRPLAGRRLAWSQRGILVVVIIIQRPGKIIWILHLGVRVGVLEALRLRLVASVAAHDTVIRTHGDAASSPLGPATAAATVVLVTVVARAGLFILDSADGPAKDALEEPGAAHVVGIHDAAAAELDALPGVVHPGKVNVERRLDDAKDDGHGVRLAASDVKLADEPV